jgi:hypothetical protein
MSVYDYQLASGQTRWFYIIDLPPDADGHRRQQKRAGFRNQAAALSAEKDARAIYGGADLTADGSLAAELEGWLAERELDVAETTLSNYRDILRCYVIPQIGARQLYTLDKRVIHDLYKTLLARVHSGQEPHDLLCLNCHAYRPRAVRQHGWELLNAAGWDDERIDATVRRAQRDPCPGRCGRPVGEGNCPELPGEEQRLPAEGERTDGLGHVLAVARSHRVIACLAIGAQRVDQVAATLPSTA